ncbi:MAG TPA: NAD(P)-dependent oxidoreductase, partial [Planctomycetes bacterium]|nr:NAD(P)-dependent oxidoreductase [Planctomycetota bacterium]
MKIAVTGGTGFVGRALVEELIERGEAVTIVSRSPDKLPV